MTLSSLYHAPLSEVLLYLERIVPDWIATTDAQSRCLLLGISPSQDPLVAVLNLMGVDGAWTHLDQARLLEIELFYASIGGLLGYYVQFLQHLLRPASLPVALAQPPLWAVDAPPLLPAIEYGIESLPSLGLMFPVGGLASRLEWKDSEGRCLPAALLPFDGRSLLHGLIEDIEGWEALYQQRTGSSVTIPLALMTSEENETEILHHIAVCHAWGRPPHSIRCFRQPSVPVLTETGKWATDPEGRYLFQPGGHGAIWRCAEQQGILDWFTDLGVTSLFIRQINNPMGGLDHGLLSLLGLGVWKNKDFGYLSCPRDPLVSEGVLALTQSKDGYSIRNIEYTEYHEMDPHILASLTANTNLLYIRMATLRKLVASGWEGGTVLNMKQSVTCRGQQVRIGRLESMMQSISNGLLAGRPEDVPTFVAYQARSKTIAPTKKKFQDTLSETPEGAWYQQLCNQEVLLRSCGVQLPSLPTIPEFIQSGPSFLFHYHPRLGPLYSIIRRKIHGGCWEQGAKLILDIVDLSWKEVVLAGRCRIRGGGRCSIAGVTIRNTGTQGPIPYAGDPQWGETCDIWVAAGAELIVEGIVLSGAIDIHVPQGERWEGTASGWSRQPAHTLSKD